MSPPFARLRDAAYDARRTASVFRRPPRSIAQRDRLELAFATLERVASRLLPGYVVGDYGRSWMVDRAVLDTIATTETERRSWDRKYALVQLLKLVEDVPGDTVEVGVFHGASSVLICRATAGAARRHWAVDSFQGLSKPGPDDGGYWQAGDMSAARAEVAARLAPFDATLVEGWVPASLDDVEASTLAFAHVDVDLYEPTRASVAWCYERLGPGGILVCDDYGFETCPGARRAMDEVMAAHPEPIVHLPTGQGVVIRRR